MHPFGVGHGEGLKTALLTSKDKLRSLLDRGTAISFSAEKPAPWLMRTLGSPPSIYSVDADIWLLKALREVALREDAALMCVVTTDYAMHKYRPGDPGSKRHMEGIDQALQETVEALETRGEEVLLCVTADHGMSEKNRAVNLELILKEHGIKAKMNTIIADRYVFHHSNLGGAAYIYLKDMEDAAKGYEVLQEVEGVEVVLRRDQAARLYHLDETRIGQQCVTEVPWLPARKKDPHHPKLTKIQVARAFTGK